MTGFNAEATVEKRGTKLAGHSLLREITSAVRGLLGTRLRRREPYHQVGCIMSRILLVDDEETLRQVLTEVLEDEGYTVLEARHGREALHILAKEAVDLIVMDVMMPVMTGLEVVQEVRKRSDDVTPPIILMSSGRAVDAANPQISFIRKPFNLDELLNRVSSALGQPRQPQGVR